MKFDTTPFYFFGSKNSQDYDVLVAVDEIPLDIDKAHNICKEWNVKLSEHFPDKPLNCNLGVFHDGQLLICFKGTTDELANVLYYTYDNHTQYFPNPIESPEVRDIDEKIIRVARFIISFYSRTHLRTEIKTALRGNLGDRIEVLKKIDFYKMTEFPGKKEKKEDIYKVLAFQYGQVFSLIDGYEPQSYSKNEIAKNYPELKNMLMRGEITDYDLEVLNEHNHRFIQYVIANYDEVELKTTEVLRK